jgi:serine/threonine protein phosphatase PrpC
VHGVFDGHGGSDTAQYLHDEFANRVYDAISSSLPETVAETADLLHRVVLETDSHICTDLTRAKAQSIDAKHADEIIALIPGLIGGSTVSIVVQWRDTAYVINIGDSITMVFEDAENIFTTREHKPSDPEEARHISSVGGTRVGDYVVIEDGGLGMSRAIGDCGGKITHGSWYSPDKGAVRATPDIIPIAMRDVFEYHFISMTDGIFENHMSFGRRLLNLGEKMTTARIAQLVHYGGLNRDTFCKDLAESARKKFKSYDDISIIVV